MKLTFEAETFGDIVREVQLFIHQAGAVPGEMAKHGMDEKTQTDSPDAFVRDFKDDFDPTLDQKKLDDPLPDEMTDPKPKNSRRKLGSVSKTIRLGSASPASASKAKASKRKGNSKLKPTSIGQNLDDEITDIDLIKAASSAAKVLTPKEVKQVLEDVGVAVVGEIPQEERRAFLDTLNALLSDANG